jgi:5-methylcytosine-specific restriction endonuclease McrA
MSKAQRKGIPGYHTLEEWEAIIEWFGYACVYCESEENITKDHIIPTSRGGSNDPENLQLLCRSCNSKKNARIEAPIPTVYKPLRENRSDLMPLVERMITGLDELAMRVKT